MKRFMVGLVLVIVIFISFTFVILRLIANGSENNFFNANYRSRFASQPVLRKFLGLHFDGDAKADYLDDRYDTIYVNVDYMAGLEISETALDLLKDRMEAITHKRVIIEPQAAVVYEAQVDDKDIEEILARSRNQHASGANLDLLVLSEYEGNLNHLGSTYQENVILLFGDALKDFTKSNPKTYDNFVESTALHEFGHQIGLPHNQEPGCLMNDFVESGSRTLARDVVTDFCDFEKGLIASQRPTKT